MLIQATNYAMTVFAQIWLWFKQLLEATNLDGLYVIMVTIVAAYRLLARPIMGAALSAGSDTYRAMRAKPPTLSDSKEIRKL